MTIKLSETQDAAIREVAELGYTMAKANTIKSLETKGLIVQTGATHHELTNPGREYLGLPAELEDSIMEDTTGVEAPTFHEKLMADVEELEALLEPVGTYVDEPLADWEKELLGEGSVEKYNQYWNREMVESAGFGETLKWKNTKVWDGLTAEEIRADMDTRVPANRADKRAHRKAVRKALASL